MPDLSDAELIRQFIELDEEIGFLNMLRGLNATEAEATKNKNMILIFSQNGKLEVHSYRDAPEALRALFQMEKDHPGKDIVLVRADTSDEIRVAFKNYFSDAREFLDLIDRGCQLLSGRRFGRVRSARTSG